MVLGALSLAALTVAFFKLFQFLWYRVGNEDAAFRSAVSRWAAGSRTEALGTVEQSRSAASHIVKYAMGRIAENVPEQFVREDVERRALDHLAFMRRHLRILEAVAQLAPLIGLFGTVVGMMEAFQTLQNSGSQADPAALAGGIWVALITTAVGLAVAIPAAFAMYWFEGRLGQEQRLIESAITQVLLGANGIRRLESAQQSESSHAALA